MMWCGGCYAEHEKDELTKAGNRLGGTWRKRGKGDMRKEEAVIIFSHTFSATCSLQEHPRDGPRSTRGGIYEINGCYQDICLGQILE